MSGSSSQAGRPSTPHLVLDRLEKRFGDGDPAVRSLSIEVGSGELLGLLGPSGCGKTTTLRMIAGLMSASGGRIAVGGVDVTALPPYRRNMGVVFQNYALFPHMTVAENLAFGLKMRGVGRAERDARVSRALDLVRLGSFAGRRPVQLSGGQQQRIALARALVIEPSILLLDEPLSNLDANLREEMRTEIRDIQQRLGITTVFVTHDQTEALAACDRIAVMRAGQLEQLGTPFEVYERPASAFVAGFVGRINQASGVRRQDGGIMLGDSMVRSPSSSVPAGPVELMVRPHRIAITGSDVPVHGRNFARGQVRRTTYVGDILIVDVQVGPATLSVEQHTSVGSCVSRPGQEVVLAWDEEDTLLFPQASSAGA